MTNHSANRPNARRTLRVALLCAGVLVLGACSGNTPEATGGGENASVTTTGNDATTVPSTIPATSTIDAETVKDAIRNALEGPVRVSGTTMYIAGEEEKFTLNVDETGNWSLSEPSITDDDTRTESRSASGALYQFIDTHAADESESFVWIRNGMPGLNLTPELLQITLLEDRDMSLDALDLAELAPGPEWLNVRDRFLDAADISPDQKDGNWSLTWTDDEGYTHTIGVVLDADARLVSLLNVEESYAIEYERGTEVAPIGAPETYLEGDDAARAVWLNTFALMTREQARAIARNAAAIAASEGSRVPDDTHFEAAFGEANCGKDCSFALATKTFNLTELGFTCSTTLLPASDGQLVASRPVCVQN